MHRITSSPSITKRLCRFFSAASTIRGKRFGRRRNGLSHQRQAKVERRFLFYHKRPSRNPIEPATKASQTSARQKKQRATSHNP